jgi:hypothetical protein
MSLGMRAPVPITLKSINKRIIANSLADPLKVSRQKVPPLRAARKQPLPGEIHRLHLF